MMLSTELDPERAPSEGPSAAAVAAAAAEEPPGALAVAFVQKPQDGTADATLDVVLQPSYVYYSGGCWTGRGRSISRHHVGLGGGRGRARIARLHAG